MLRARLTGSVLACWRVRSAVDQRRLVQQGQVPKTCALRQPLIGRAGETNRGRAPHVARNCRSGGFLVPTQWTARRPVHSPAESVHVPECCTNAHPDLIHVPPLLSATVVCALRSALSYSSLDSARLLRREDAGNDTTAASGGARKASPWLVPASNEDLRSRTRQARRDCGRGRH